MSTPPPNSKKYCISNYLPASTLVIGGAYAGKSEFALSLIDPQKPTTVIGTGILDDPIFLRRINRLKESRPQGWEQVDIKTELNETLRQVIGDNRQVLIDSLNQWIATLVMGHSHNYTDEQITDIVLSECSELTSLLESSQESVVIVSSEVGSGISPPRAIARLFRMLVSRANAHIAARCEQVILLTAGIPHVIKGTSQEPSVEGGGGSVLAG